MCVTPPGCPEQTKTQRPSLSWEKMTVKVGGLLRVTHFHVVFHGMLVK